MTNTYIIENTLTHELSFNFDICTCIILLRERNKKTETRSILLPIRNKGCVCVALEASYVLPFCSSKLNKLYNDILGVIDVSTMDGLMLKTVIKVSLRLSNFLVSTAPEL